MSLSLSYMQMLMMFGLFIISEKHSQKTTIKNEKKKCTVLIIQKSFFSDINPRKNLQYLWCKTQQTKLIEIIASNFRLYL